MHEVAPPIRLLSAQVADQIAAGEVIERPASVVKELVENAIDAGATQIRVHVEEAGLQCIEVSDNGWGIPREELGLALARHATSKMTTFSDLFAIRTLGFRGEALASIASVSHLTLRSKVQSQPCAYQIDGDAPDQITVVAADQGTCIAIRDLFYNVPVRRAFLKSTRTEWLAVQEVLAHIALAYPDRSFQCIHGNKTVLDWSAVPRREEACEDPALLRRIQQIMGVPFAKQAQYFSGEAVGLRVFGWILPPDAARRVPPKQYYFVNARAVRDPMLQHALRATWSTLGFESLPCVGIFWVELDPERMDVNVHPTKHAVRFHEPSLVYRVLSAAIQEVLEPIAAVQPMCTPGFRVLEAAASAPAVIQLGAYRLWDQGGQLWVVDHRGLAARWVSYCVRQGDLAPRVLETGVPITCPAALNVAPQIRLWARAGILGRCLGPETFFVEQVPGAIFGGATPPSELLTRVLAMPHTEPEAVLLQCLYDPDFDGALWDWREALYALQRAQIPLGSCWVVVAPERFAQWLHSLHAAS